MDRVLKVIGIISIVAGIIVGIIQANQTIELLGRSYDVPFRWSLAITWWVSGLVSGIVFYALGIMLEHLADISYRLKNVEHEANRGAGPKPNLGTSKASLSKLEGFKL